MLKLIILYNCVNESYRVREGRNTLSFLNIPSIVIYASASVVAWFLLYFGNKDSNLILNIIGYITYFICMFFSWDYVIYEPFIYIYFLANIAFTYIVNYCFFQGKLRCRIALMVINNAFVIAWSNVLLGTYYFYNNLSDTYYNEIMHIIVNRSHFFSSHWQLSVLFFKTALPYYFYCPVYSGVFLFQRFFEWTIPGSPVLQIYFFPKSKK